MTGKKGGKAVPMLSPENYIRQRARNLPIFECWVNTGWSEGGLAHVFVARNHSNGNITLGIYLVDLKCLGVKDAAWRFNIPESEYRELLQYSKDTMELEPIQYSLAHNIVFAGVEFADEYGFKPHRDFSSIVQFILEEDSDEIELIDIECGNEGKPLFIQGPYDDHAKTARILAQLEKTAGPGNYFFINGIDPDDEEDDFDEFDEDEDENENENEHEKFTDLDIKVENKHVKKLLQKTSPGFQFKIQLEGIEDPPVWRRIVVPSHYSFLDFSFIINNVFDWWEEHLFLFSPKGWNSYPIIQMDDEDSFDGGEVLDADDTHLSDIFKNENQKFTYIYDFGDDWTHEIVLEKILPELVNMPDCLDGEGQCPPEDCGGEPGYANLKSVLSDPSDPEYAELKEWVDLEEDEEWDPHKFDLDEVREILKYLFSTI